MGLMIPGYQAFVPLYVYALFCMDKDGPLYVKFGRTRDPMQRLRGLTTGCPVPAKYFATVEVKGEVMQANLEKGLHAQFADRRTSGEWFRFDPSIETDKRDFNDGCATQFIGCTGKILKWDKISIDALNEYTRANAKKYLSAVGRKRANRISSNIRELKKYRG
jgi:Meiotically up-regulated gene 113